jgi:hypothetical protein
MSLSRDEWREAAVFLPPAQRPHVGSIVILYRPNESKGLQNCSDAASVLQKAYGRTE